MGIGIDSAIAFAVRNITQLRRVPFGRRRRRIYRDTVAELCNWVEESVIQGRNERNDANAMKPEYILANSVPVYG